MEVVDGGETVVPWGEGREGRGVVEVLGCAGGCGLVGFVSRREIRASLEAVVPLTSETGPAAIAASMYWPKVVIPGMLVYKETKPG